VDADHLERRLAHVELSQRDNQSRGYVKTLALKLAVSCLVLVFLQFFVAGVFPAEIPQEVLRLQEYLDAEVDVVYLGDSTLAFPVGEVTTAEILQEMLPEYKIGEISHPAYNLDLYLHYVRYILLSAHRPQAIVIPVNMRSFSPEWDLRPGYQFDKVKKTLTLGLSISRIFGRPLEIFGYYKPSISQETFLNATVYRGDEPVGTVRDFEGIVDQDAVAEQGDAGFVYHDALPSSEDEDALRQALIYRYMYRLRPDQRQLQALLEIAELGHDSDVEIVFYVTPINYQQGERFLGETFPETLNENVALVKSLVEDRQAIVLDVSRDLEAFAFVDMEHLREAGKEYVSAQLAAAIRSLEDERALKPGTLTVESVSQTATTGPSPTPVAKPATRTFPTLTPRATVSATVEMLPTPTVSPTLTPTRVVATGGTVVETAYLLRSMPEGGDYPVDVYRLVYQTLDRDGQLVDLEADLFIPYVDSGTSFPILVHAAGTTGIGDGCAPLDERPEERNWGNYRLHSLAYAAQGYVVILPNGLGFDDPERIHPYFVAELQAHVLLDAARAAYDFARGLVAVDVLAEPAQAVFFMGYSSGGHAVFAARDWAETYAPELAVMGVIGFGPTTHVETLMKEDPIFSPYTVYAYRNFYGDEIVDVEDVFLPNWVDGFESDVLTKCVDDIFMFYSRSPRDMYSPEFREILFGDRLRQEYPRFAEALSANSAGLRGGSRIPVLILQGTGDTVVTPDSQRRFKDQLCANGGSVTYLEYSAIAHVNVRWTSFGDVLLWMQRIGEGDVPENDCEALDE
jgi:acetyl esterase/lipase